jgi:2',3'-cyclic-nucleotide 2'-phosphodiesterase (5'-nucleotidase family)
LGSEYKNYPTKVGELVDSVVYYGVYKAMETLSRKLDPEGGAHNGAPAGSKTAEKPKGKLLTLWHTSNVRGEREDCGCKRHPRGGLTRKATLLKNAHKAGRDLDRPDGALVLDAGDLLFAGTHLSRMSKNDRKVAQIRAEAIIASFNLIGCSAFLPGEYDLALGLDALKALRAKAKFPFVSANLREAGSAKLLYDPFVLTQAAGFKVAIVGLTNPKTATKGYYEKAGVEVEAPADALRKQAQAINASGAQVVILLSNLGVDGTTKVLQEVPRQDLPVTLAVVSNSARSTHVPIWSEGTPVIESGNRGKFVGRVDMHIVDGQVRFLPKESQEVKHVRDYMNAYRSVHHSRRSVSKIPTSTKNEARDRRIRRNLTMAIERLAKREALLPAKIEKAAKGDETPSWLHNQIVPVELAIEQDKSVRRAIDDLEKKALALLPKPPKKSKAPKKVKTP